MSVIENMKSCTLTHDMELWLNKVRHEKGLYHMMYDKESISKFREIFKVSKQQSRIVILDWYNKHGE